MQRKMKTMINYVVCSVALFITIVLVLQSSLMMKVAGFMFAALLYVSGQLWPTFWRRFWITNARILNYFDCL